MNLDNLAVFALAFGGAFLAALWLSLVFWVYRDVRNRARDPLMHWLAALLVAVLNLPGVIIYLVLRPPQTLEEAYQRMLEEEALLTAIEEQPVCPGCERHVKPEWRFCPYCHTRLKKACESCGQMLDLAWNLCPWCGEAVAGARVTIKEPPDGNPPTDEEPELDDLPLQL